MRNGDNQMPKSALIESLSQVAVLFDPQPIRAACFSPNQAEYFVLGTNSKSLKFCKLSSQIIQQFEGPDYGDDAEGMPDRTKNIQVVQEITDHHDGSIYCVDWSRNVRLVATGSNDKLIKVIYVPSFEEQD